MTNKIDKLNEKLLKAAVSAKKAKEIKDLIAKGGDVNCVNDCGLTPILLAAQYNPAVAVLNVLIKEGADLTRVEPEYKSNALHLAANSNSNPKIILTLLKEEFNIEEKNYLGETPLIMAVKNNKETKVVSTLLKEGANASEKDYKELSVFDYAKLNKRKYIINSLKKMNIEY